MSDYGIKVSLPGFDVTTAAPEDCAIHSGYQSPKIDIKADPPHYGILDIDFTSTMATDTDVLLWSQNHGRSYRPMVIGTADLDHKGGDAGDGQIDGILTLSPTATLIVWIDATDTKARLFARHSSGFTWIGSGSNLKVSFFIFVEQSS